MPAAEATNVRMDWKQFQEIAPEIVTGMATISHSLKGAYETLKGHFTESEIGLLTVAISQINAWNRIAAPDSWRFLACL